MSDGATQDGLKAVFGQFGELAQVRQHGVPEVNLLRDPNMGTSAFINFVHYESADAARRALNGKVLPGLTRDMIIKASEAMQEYEESLPERPQAASVGDGTWNSGGRGGGGGAGGGSVWLGGGGGGGGATGESGEERRRREIEEQERRDRDMAMRLQVWIQPQAFLSFTPCTMVLHSLCGLSCCGDARHHSEMHGNKWGPH